MAIYGKTWWGKKWLETFTGIDYDNRLARGRTYANTGRAYDIDIQNNVITARVQGSRPTPYKVKIELQPFDLTTQQTIRTIITDSPSILSALINKKLPSSLLQKLNDRNIKLFPSQWKELSAHCNCPDWAMPCKHLAAVIYLICAEIDKNPFTIFHLHNCDLLNIIDDFKDGKLASAQQISSIEDSLKSDGDTTCKFNQFLLDEIDFSKIPELLNHIIAMLQDDPPFYDTNFRTILHLAYKNWQRYPHGKIVDYTKFDHIPSKTNKNVELSEEEIFLEKWQHPEQWDAFNITIDDNYRLISITNHEQQLFGDIKLTKNIGTTLVFFLEQIPNAILHKLCPKIRFTHMIFQFCVKLMEKSALIPQILQNKKNETFIRWLPALFDSNVAQVFNQLCSSCPKEFIQYKKNMLNPEQQVKIAIHVILSQLMIDNFTQPLNRISDRDIFQLFFLQKSYNSKNFTNNKVPASIHQWLSNLYLSEKEHALYLMVTNKNDTFELELHVSSDRQKTPVSVSQALKSTNEQVKLSILSDVSLIAEHIPKIEFGIDNSTSITFDLNDFAPLFLQALPILKIMGVNIILPKELHKILKPKLSLNLKTKDTISSNDRTSFLKLETLLDFDWQIALGETTISVAEFKKMLQESHGLIRLIDQYILLDEKEMHALLKKLDKLPNHLSHSDLMQAALAKDFHGAVVSTDNDINLLFNQLEQYTPVKIPQNLQAQLRPYQERGFNWLIQNIQTGFGSILADDMGLGKTIQVIATLL